MAGFMLNDDGDIGVDNNGKMLLLSTYKELVKQRLNIKLKTFKGEWWLDTTFGIPYRDTGDGKAIIGKGLTKSDIDALYVATIKEDPDVISIEYFNSVYTPIQRQYNLSFEVKTRDLNLESTQIASQAWEEVSYEYMSNLITSSCDVNFNQWVLDYHPIVHNDLPEAMQPPYPWE